jgi:predicted Zn-dependent protease with MMP-like domain
MADPLFDRVIQEVLKELPTDLRGALASVEILVQDRPKGNRDLLGLFEGLSLKESPIDEKRLFPDRITLYEGNLKRSYPDRKDLARQVRLTLLHELGHFFGFSEKELKDRGYE